MNVILLLTFATRDRPQPQNPSAVTPSRIWVSCPPEAVKNDSGTVQTVKATAIWWAIRLKSFNLYHFPEEANFYIRHFPIYSLLDLTYLCNPIRLTRPVLSFFSFPVQILPRAQCSQRRLIIIIF